MAAPNSIKSDKLARLIGTPASPIVIDVRTQEDFDADPRLLPTSLKRSHRNVAEWGESCAGKPVVVVCHHGAKLSEGTAAWLRQLGADAIALEGGFVAWEEAKLPLMSLAMLPNRDPEGRTLWVTRSRPKIDRIACPWLIRRFVDPSAIFLFVAAQEVAAVADRFGATAFDIENTHWSHRGDLCTFDVMIEEFGLTSDALLHLATIVRAADTAKLDLAPEAAGLLAASLGLSRMYSDDLEQLDAGMLLYDAFYRWCRDATDETHNWPTNKVKP
jgi:rhodanese-related sulfurtransferase